jgi:trigger factor
MQVSVETVGSIGRRVTVAVPAEQVEKEVGAKLRKMAQSARLPGFRPGKAPIKVVEGRYGKDVLNEVAANLIDTTLREALTQEKLVPAGGPSVEPTKLERGEDLEYVASFDIYPEIKRMDIDGVQIERPTYEVKGSDIDATVDTMRKQRLMWQPVERPAGGKDRVMIDFEGSVDGESFPGNSAENFAVVLGEKSLLKDFEDGLKGSEGGQQLDLQVNFPEDYHGQEVAGKCATFSVTVREVAEAVYPELDEEFVKSFGVADGDIEKLRGEVRENVEREMADRVRRILRQRVFDALTELNEIDLPDKMVEAEIDQLIESNKKILEGQGVPVGNVKPDRGNFRESAEKRVALGLIMQAVVEKHEIKPDAGRVRERIEAIGSGYEEPAVFVQWYYSDRNRLAQMESMILEEQVIEKMLDGADVKDKEISFDELMQNSGE